MPPTPPPSEPPTPPTGRAGAGAAAGPWAGLLTDTSVEAGLRDPVAALRAYAGRAAPLVGALQVGDTGLPAALEALAGHAPHAAPPLVVRLTGGAGQLAGPVALCTRRDVQPVRLVVALRDLDDLPGNARRVVAAVDAARAAGDLAEETVVAVGLPDTGGPPGSPTHGWLAAADEVAAAELALALPTAGTATAPPPDPRTTVAWIDAALDRELPTTGAASGAAGVAALLLATRLVLDGASADDVAPLLAGQDRARLRTALDEVGAEALQGARRWLLAVATDHPDRVAEDLLSLVGGAP